MRAPFSRPVRAALAIAMAIMAMPTSAVDAPRSAEDRYLGGTFGLAVRL